MQLLNKHIDGSPSDAVYIGRGSTFGNLKVIGKDGTREEVIEWYRGWLCEKLIERDPIVERDFRRLTPDSRLLCFCHPKPCHGQVIIDYWNEINAHVDYETGLREFIKKHRKGFQYVPLNDGIDHINVYSKAQTKLGRVMSNFGHTPFTHKEYGAFRSVEAFWYWLATGKKHEELRDLFGYEAKQQGKKYERVHVDNFIPEVKKAILLKFEQNPGLANALKESTLPLTHYYFYGDVCNPKVIPDKNGQWFVDYLESVRRYLRGEAHKVIIAGSRGIEDLEVVRQAYQESGFEAVEIVSGGARGVDRLGEELAKELQLPVERFIPDWIGQGKPAGIIRNHVMGDYATAAVTCWDGASPGTKDMIDYMTRKSKPVFVKKPKAPSE